MPPRVIDRVESNDLLLLDTHIWIWAFHGEAAKVARELPGIIEAASGMGRLRLSAVSVWEAAHAIMRGRVRIRGILDEWIEHAIAAYGGQVRSIERWRLRACVFLGSRAVTRPTAS